MIVAGMVTLAVPVSAAPTASAPSEREPVICRSAVVITVSAEK